MRAVLHIFENPDQFDVEEEWERIVKRYQDIRGSLSSSSKEANGGGRGGGGSEERIARLWHLMNGVPPHENQFSYRDQLHAFASSLSPEHQVKEWEREIYSKKVELRQAWKLLEKLGKGNEFVEGVDSEDEWVEVMRRVLEWWEKEGQGRGEELVGVVGEVGERF